MTPHQTHHPAPGPSEDGPGAGVPGNGSENEYGPPDWFAAAGEPSEPVAGAAGEPPVDELPGLVRASELPGGRRRRRSALGELPETAPAVAERPRAKAERAERAEQTGRAEAREPRESRRGRAAVPEGDPAERARDICLRLLTGAAKSRKQLADALRRKEIPDETVEQVLDRLEEVGLIDDAAFAEAWVESRHAVRGLSRRALAQELRTKGVTGETAERALLQVDAEDETEAARALVARKLRSTAGLERGVRTRRLVGVLARRGYAEGLAFRVVREALDAEGAEEEDWPEEGTD